MFRAWLWPQLALRLHRLVPRAGAWTVALLVSQGLFALLMEPHGPPPTLVMAGVAIVMAVGVVLARRHRGASGGLRMTVAKG